MFRLESRWVSFNMKKSWSQSQYFLIEIVLAKHMILQVHQLSHSPNHFPKLKTNLMSKIWGYGVYQNIYDSTNLHHIKRGVLEVLWPIGNSYVECQEDYYEEN